MRDGWVIAPLGRFITQSKKKVKVLDGEEYPAIGVMMEGRGFVTRPPFVGGNTTYKQLTPIEPHQLVLRSITAWEAPIQVTTMEHAGFHVSGVFPVFDIDTANLDPQFLSLLCRYEPFWESMRERTVGSVLRRKTLSAKALMEIPIQLPPLPEQKRIVDLISSTDSYIESLQQLLESAKKSRNAVLHELLTSSGDGWVEISISDLIAHSIGGIWGLEEGKDEVDVTVVRSTEFTQSGFLNFSTGVMRSIKASQLQSRQLVSGDILLEKSGGGPTQPVGRVVFVEDSIPPKTVCSNFVLLIRPNKELVDSKFLFNVLLQWHFQNRTLEFQAQTTGIRNLRTNDYLDQLLLLPPLVEQEQILNSINSFDDHVLNLDATLQAVRKLRSGLLSDLLSGAHEIPTSYDKVMEAV